MKTIFWIKCWHLNSLQNDVCFNYLAPKLWEKIHFFHSKVYFSGEGKNIKTSIWTVCKIYNVKNNTTADIWCFYHYIDEIKWKYVKKQNFPYLRPAPLSPSLIFNIHPRKKNENYVEFDFSMGTVLMIFSFFWMDNTPCLPLPNL